MLTSCAIWVTASISIPRSHRIQRGSRRSNRILRIPFLDRQQQRKPLAAEL